MGLYRCRRRSAAPDDMPHQTSWRRGTAAAGHYGPPPLPKTLYGTCDRKVRQIRSGRRRRAASRQVQHELLLARPSDVFQCPDGTVDCVLHWPNILAAPENYVALGGGDELTGGELAPGEGD